MIPKLLACSQITGTTIKNKEGKNIGKIEDMMIDWTTGSVAYAVLSFGGFLGIGEKLFAIPLDAFDFESSEEGDIILDIDKESLESAPGFDKEHWPQNPDRTFISSVYSHYGYEPYWSRYSQHA